MFKFVRRWSKNRSNRSPETCGGGSGSAGSSTKSKSRKQGTDGHRGSFDLLNVGGESSNMLRPRGKSCSSTPTARKNKANVNRSVLSAFRPQTARLASPRKHVAQLRSSLGIMVPRAARKNSDEMGIMDDKMGGVYDGSPGATPRNRSPTPQGNNLWRFTPRNISPFAGAHGKNRVVKKQETKAKSYPNTPVQNKKKLVKSIKSMSAIEIEIEERLSDITYDRMCDVGMNCDSVVTIRTSDDRLKTVNAELSNGHTLLFNVVNLKQENYVDAILLHGADPNVPDDTGTTAAMLATSMGLSKSAKKIVRWKATNLSAADSEGNTVLILAAKHETVDIARDFCKALRSRKGLDSPELAKSSEYRRESPSGDPNFEHRNKLDIIQKQNSNGASARSIAVAGEDKELVKIIDTQQKYYMNLICSNCKAAVKNQRVANVLYGYHRRTRSLNNSRSSHAGASGAGCVEPCDKISSEKGTDTTKLSSGQISREADDLD